MRDRLKFLVKLFRTKFSIRLSILSILLLLLVGVSVIIIGINYFSINSILVTSAKDTLTQSSGRIAGQVQAYLEPLNSKVSIARRMFKEGVTDPKQAEFTRFLYSLIVDNENLSGVYWGDPKGNFYWLNKQGKGFIEDIVLRDNKDNVLDSMQRKLTGDGQLINTNKVPNNVLDPRLRPWYQQAEAYKDLIWVVYRFSKIGEQEAQLGVTSTFPVYGARGELAGVFGIDILLGEISKYVKNIKLTKHSFIFVVDMKGDLVTSYTPQGDLTVFNESTPNMSQVKAPWLQESFALFQNVHKSPFTYSMGGKKYIAAYEKISGVKSDYPWYVAIVTPIDDIVAPLRKIVFIGSIFIGLSLLVGIILASIFSSSLSRPIRQLAWDANLICQLELDSVKYLFSRIKEIADMADAFEKMKNALHSFQRYMPTILVKKLIISNKIAAVGGEAKDLVLLFTDIQDFTKLSENFEPEKIMKYLSEYFQAISKVIIETNGTVDKYIGDGVMAFWGAPIDDDDHVLHSCQAALKAQQALGELNKKWLKEGSPSVVTRFGISSGRVIVGNVGSDDRLSYTSLGDPVNLASRLENLNKSYATTIMVSEFVYEKVKDQFKFKLLDRVAVKGKTQGVYIYELLAEKGAKLKLDLDKYNAEFLQAFSSYESGDWQTALDLFEELSKKYPSDKPIQILIERCSNLIKNPPTSWEGVWVLDEK